MVAVDSRIIRCFPALAVLMPVYLKRERLWLDSVLRFNERYVVIAMLIEPKIGIQLNDSNRRGANS